MSKLSPVVTIIIFFVVGVTCLLFYSWSRMVVIEQGYALTTLTNEQKKLLDDNAKLKLQIAALRSPERIENLAITKFHLQQPESWQVVELRNKFNATVASQKW